MHSLNGTLEKKIMFSLDFSLLENFGKFCYTDAVSLATAFSVDCARHNAVSRLVTSVGRAGPVLG